MSHLNSEADLKLGSAQGWSFRSFFLGDQSGFHISTQNHLPKRIRVSWKATRHEDRHGFHPGQKKSKLESGWVVRFYVCGWEATRSFNLLRKEVFGSPWLSHWFLATPVLPTATLVVTCDAPRLAIAVIAPVKNSEVMTSKKQASTLAT